jgi:hypothetical protein
MLKAMLKRIFASAGGAGNAPAPPPALPQAAAPALESRAAMPAVAPQKAPLLEAPPSVEEYEAKLVEQMNAITRDAQDRRMLHVFVDVATWKLAAIAHHGGIHVAGDIQARLGWHLRQIAEQELAGREAQAARGEGRLH